MDKKTFNKIISEEDISISSLKKSVEAFCESREWGKFHNAKDLAIALSIESSELLEIFRWKNQDEMKSLFDDLKKKEKIEGEVADIFYFLLRFSQIGEIDLARSLLRKIEKNAIKYPIEKFKGSNKKYNEI